MVSIIQIFFSIFWTFFFFTCGIDTAVRGARSKSGFFASISILAFVSMLFFGANVYFKFKMIKQDIEQWKNQQKEEEAQKIQGGQSIKTKILNLF